MKKGAELALNFMLRLVFGMIAIFLINVVRRAGVFDVVKIHKDCIPGLSKRHK